MKWYKRASLQLSLPLALVVGTGALAQGVNRVCADYDSAKKTLAFTLSNGCVSSSMKYLGHDFKVEQGYVKNSVKISGGFKYKAPLSRIGTADCMGRRQVSIVQPSAAPRRYNVMVAGKWVGTFDFADSSGRICKAVISHKARVPGGSKSDIPGYIVNNYRPVNMGNYQTRLAKSPFALLSQLTAGHMNQREGRPETKISIRTEGQLFLARIRQYGYLDDSVSGGDIVAVIARKGKGFELLKVYKRSMCGRGANAGMWTKKPCP